MGSDPEIAEIGDRPQNGTVTFVARAARSSPRRRADRHGTRADCEAIAEPIVWLSAPASGDRPGTLAPCRWTSAQLRVLRSRPPERRSGRPHLHLRVHILRPVRRRALPRRLPQLRRELRAAADPPRGAAAEASGVDASGSSPSTPSARPHSGRLLFRTRSSTAGVAAAAALDLNRYTIIPDISYGYAPGDLGEGRRRWRSMPGERGTNLARPRSWQGCAGSAPRAAACTWCSMRAGSSA